MANFLEGDTVETSAALGAVILLPQEQQHGGAARDGWLRLPLHLVTLHLLRKFVGRTMTKLRARLII